MVAFRKLFPALALVGLAVGLTSTASAQNAPLTCNSVQGVPTLVRAEGFTELGGDIVIQCTGGNPSVPFLANVQIFLNTNITSKLLSAGGQTVSEATLLIDEPGSASNITGQPFCPSPAPVSNSAGIVTGTVAPGCNGFIAGNRFQTGTYNAFLAQQAAQANSVVWAGVPIVPPGSALRTIRITNVRANAAGLGVSSTLIPTQIVALISVSGSQSLTLNNPQQPIAYIQQGLQFSVRNNTNTGGISSTGLALLQCVNNLNGLRTDVNSSSSTAQETIRFREGFQNAFKLRIASGQVDAPPGSVFGNSESGFVRTATPFVGDTAGSPGVATNATRLAARFNNVPLGIRIFVSTRQVTSGTSFSSPSASAVLISTDTNGNSGFSTTATIAGTGSLAPGSVPASELSVVNGSALAVWEVTGSDPSLIEDLFFDVGFASTPALGVTPVSPAVGTGTVTGNFAPFYTAASGANTASSSLPIPRFIDNPTTANAFVVNICQTNILFPFVTNQAGFDTGIAISNTSRDPFTSVADRLQGGRCTLNYYGTTTGGGAAPASQTTNADVTAGSQLTFVLSSGGGLGLAGTPGFQGYLIASCNFLYAHGFAFITDGPIGQARVAEGYLGLILDNSSYRPLFGAEALDN